MPLFSVIIPVYNVEKYLCRCIDSILNQSFNDYEIIIIDDGSTDRCAAIVDDYAKRFDNITVIHKKNGGLGAARNTGLDLVRGEYIIFVDSDDWVESDYFLVANEIIKKHNPDFIHFGWFEDTESNSKFCFDDECEKLDVRQFLLQMIRDEISCQVWKNIYRTSLWNGVRFPKRLYEDLYTTHLVLASAENIVCYNKAYYHYLIRQDNISNTKNPIKGRDIFWGFVARSEYSAEENIGLNLYPKICSSAIQAIHGLCVINDFKEIESIAKFTLKQNSRGQISIANRIELLFACKISAFYIAVVNLYYKYIRRL